MAEQKQLVVRYHEEGDLHAILIKHALAVDSPSNGGWSKGRKLEQPNSCCMHVQGIQPVYTSVDHKTHLFQLGVGFDLEMHLRAHLVLHNKIDDLSFLLWLGLVLSRCLLVCHVAAASGPTEARAGVWPCQATHPDSLKFPLRLTESSVVLAQDGMTSTQHAQHDQLLYFPAGAERP